MMNHKTLETKENEGCLSKETTLNVKIKGRLGLKTLQTGKNHVSHLSKN